MHTSFSPTRKQPGGHFKGKTFEVFFRILFLKGKKMHFSFNPSKEFRIRVSKRRYAIVAGAVGPVAPSTGIFEETQNKIDNKLLVFELVTREPRHLWE